MQDWSLAEINSFLTLMTENREDKEETRSQMTNEDWRDFLSFSESDEDWDL